MWVLLCRFFCLATVCAVLPCWLSCLLPPALTQSALHPARALLARSGLSAGALSNNPMFAGTPTHPTPPSVNLKSLSGRLSLGGGAAGGGGSGGGTPHSASSGGTPASTGMRLAERLQQGACRLGACVVLLLGGHLLKWAAGLLDACCAVYALLCSSTGLMLLCPHAHPLAAVAEQLRNPAAPQGLAALATPSGARAATAAATPAGRFEFADDVAAMLQVGGTC